MDRSRGVSMNMRLNVEGIWRLSNSENCRNNSTHGCHAGVRTSVGVLPICGWLSGHSADYHYSFLSPCHNIFTLDRVLCAMQVMTV